MALPTRYTPGYGYFYTVGTHPDVACNCLRRWLPVLQSMARYRGILGPTEKLRVWQCTGGDSRSAGTHSLGAAFDIGVPDPSVWHDPVRRDYKKPGRKTAALIYLAREMGALPTWARIDVDGRWDGDPWENNEHIHGSIRCPHNARVAYQYDEWLAGGDGVIGSGKDPHPRPPVRRTWEQGITWANAQMSGTTTTTHEEDDDMPTVEEFWNTKIKREVNGKTVYVSAIQELADAKSLGQENAEAIDALKARIAAVPNETMNVPVHRGEVDVPVIQEIADIKTTMAQLAATVAAIKAKLP